MSVYFKLCHIGLADPDRQAIDAAEITVTLFV